MKFEPKLHIKGEKLTISKRNFTSIFEIPIFLMRLNMNILLWFQVQKI